MNLPPSPKLVALAENNVNLINGTPIIKVPITEISTSSMKVPIFLSYNAKGNKVSSIASSVGLSWTLNTGGYITRIVRGTPDDYNKEDKDNNNMGMLRQGIATDIYNFVLSTCENNFWTLNGFFNKYSNPVDCEPDIFYFSINGKSGL